MCVVKSYKNVFEYPFLQAMSHRGFTYAHRAAPQPTLILKEDEEKLPEKLNRGKKLRKPLEEQFSERFPPPETVVVIVNLINQIDINNVN